MKANSFNSLRRFAIQFPGGNAGILAELGLKHPNYQPGLVLLNSSSKVRGTSEHPQRGCS
jgi:hypothetical protein